MARFLPGHVFSITWHPRGDVNAEWFITATRHHGEQPGVLEHEAPSSEPGAGRGLRYSSQIRAIPQSARYVPQWEHPKRREDGLQSAIVTGPSGEEVYTDEYGRVKVQFHWDRLGQRDENTTCWVRVADSWAGPNFGFIQIPRIGQEVMVEFMEGDPDRPVITGRVYNQVQMPPWQLPEQKTLSGIQSREFKGGQRNQLLLDDTQGQVQAQLSSDHGLSQLNLGYITRIKNLDGRKDFRGEGFELRTDHWGVLRAGKGLVISTNARISAAGHQNDLGEAAEVLRASTAQHEEQAQIAASRNAQDEGDIAQPAEAIKRQATEIIGNGKKYGEMAAPHLLLSSPAGIALATPENIHLASTGHTAITAAGEASLATSRSFLVTALKKISLFAKQMGVRIFAGKGKVEIQAQSDGMDLIADKDLRILSATSNIEIGAKEEILLHAGKSYIRINSNGIEIGTKGKFTVHAASHAFEGSKGLDKPFAIDLREWPDGKVTLDHRYHDDTPVHNAPFEAILSDGSLRKGTLDSSGKAVLEGIPPGPISVRYGPDQRPYKPAELPANPRYGKKPTTLHNNSKKGES